MDPCCMSPQSMSVQLWQYVGRWKVFLTKLCPRFVVFSTAAIVWSPAGHPIGKCYARIDCSGVDKRCCQRSQWPLSIALPQGPSPQLACIVHRRRHVLVEVGPALSALTSAARRQGAQVGGHVMLKPPLRDLETKFGHHRWTRNCFQPKGNSRLRGWATIYKIGQGVRRSFILQLANAISATRSRIYVSWSTPLMRNTWPMTTNT